MTTFPLFALVNGLAMQVWTQDYVALGNFVPLADIDAPVYDVDCVTRLASPAYLV